MATRCHIIVGDYNAMIYRHSDGYPNGRAGVLFMLKPLVKKFMQGRGFLDAEYLTAHIAHRCIEIVQRDRAGNRKHYKETTGKVPEYLDGPDFLGIGIQPFTKYFQGDVAYVYKIVQNKTVNIEIYQRSNNSAGNLTWADLRLIETVVVK